MISALAIRRNQATGKKIRIADSEVRQLCVRPPGLPRALRSVPHRRLDRAGERWACPDDGGSGAS